MDIFSQLKMQNNKYEEAQFYYKEGITLNDLGYYLSAETAFLKAINQIEKYKRKGSYCIL